MSETIIELDALRVLLLSVCVFWFGLYLNKKISFLETYNIPAPVTGGFLCSILVALLAVFANIKLNFDLLLSHLRQFEAFWKLKLAGEPCRGRVVLRLTQRQAAYERASNRAADYQYRHQNREEFSATHSLASLTHT